MMPPALPLSAVPTVALLICVPFQAVSVLMFWISSESPAPTPMLLTAALVASVALTTLLTPPI